MHYLTPCEECRNNRIVKANYDHPDEWDCIMEDHIIIDDDTGCNKFDRKEAWE